MKTDRADSGSGTRHHFALALEPEVFALEQNRLEDMGVELNLGEHLSFGWQSIYMYDPDGNPVELVCYDASTFGQELNQPVQPGNA